MVPMTKACHLPSSLENHTGKDRHGRQASDETPEPHRWFWHQRVLPGEEPGPTPVPGELMLFWPVLPGG